MLTFTTSLAITPANNTPLTFKPKAIYVGNTGNVVVTMGSANTTVTFFNVPQGTLLPVRAAYVLTTTTANNLIGLV